MVTSEEKRLVGITRASQECGQIREKPRHAVHRIPLTKNGLRAPLVAYNKLGIGTLFLRMCDVSLFMNNITLTILHKTKLSVELGVQIF